MVSVSVLLHLKFQVSVSVSVDIKLQVSVWVEILVTVHLYQLPEVKSVSLPANVNSATLHPEKMVFVVGGEDFKLYKY